MEDIVNIKNEYAEHFKARPFLRAAYQNSAASKDLGDERKALLRLFYEGIKSVPEINGRVLDIGTGPSLTSLMPVSKGTCEITATGFLENERMELQKWLKSDPDAYGWQFWFDFTAELEGQGVTAADIEGNLRAKVKDVLPCDIHMTNPLQPATPEQYDVIVSQCVIEAACPTEESFLQALQNVLTLLKQGGRIILISGLGINFYTFDQHTYGSLSITSEFVKRVLKKAGIENITIKTCPPVPVGDQEFYNYNSTGLCFGHGYKK